MSTSSNCGSKSICLATISKKQIMAVAGLGLCLFVLAHVLGNFLLFVGPETYNMYSHKLITNPLIYVAEAGLIAIFLGHVIAGVILTIRNCKARPKGYAVSGSGDKKTSITTKTMWWQGVVILIFVVTHLITFKFGTLYEVTYGAETVRDLFRLVYEVFQSPIYVGWYIFSVALLGVHLSHGLYSSLQTLGVNHPRYTPIFQKVSLLYGVVIAGGFIAQPLYMFFFYRG
jgi:succinate dehydrogenase / fumarate reductase cytochrome b subunit